VEDEIQITKKDVLRLKKTKVNDKTDSLKTTTFYQTLLSLKTKRKYKLSEMKTFDLEISNFGCRDLFVPEFLIYGFKDDSSTELYVEIFKKDINGDYNRYINDKSNIHYQYYSYNREIIALKNNLGQEYNKLEVDFLNNIIEPGVYSAKIYVDLSNFGYFKKLVTTTASFEVVE